MTMTHKIWLVIEHVWCAHEAIEWANNLDGGLSKEEIDAIRVSRESLLFKGKEQWVKTRGNFDVTMGSKDGAECCEVVDLFLIHQITEVEKILPKSDFGTFRDDYLGITGTNKASNERVKKQLIIVFKKVWFENRYSNE